MLTIQEAWEKRSRQYGRRIEGVLPKSFPRPVNRYLHNWMFKQIEKIIPKRGRVQVLDLGCGYGRLSSEILNRFPKAAVFGIDVSQNSVDLYNQSLSPRGKAIKGDITKLPFESNFFDVVFMVTTLMYLTKKADQEKAISELFRVLRADGRFVIIERNPTGHSIVMLGGLIEKIRGKGKKEITAVSFPYEYIKKLIDENGGLVRETDGIPAWTLTLHLAIVLSFISDFLLRNFVRIISFLDQKLDFLLTPSLYIAYSGKARRENKQSLFFADSK